jgi:tRNA pseudouridine55 synthase
MTDPQSAIMTNPQSAIRNPQSFDGVLVIDKPAALTSHDVVARVRKILRTRRVGHTGTLDPFATGVLVVCVNRATRLVRFLTGDDKEYVATMRLGFATDTADLTGKPVSSATDAGHITSEMVNEAFVRFRGRLEQVPPMYSAKKVGGVRLYEMARRGQQVERAPVEIEIKELELIPGTRVFQDFSFRVVCSAGTYIRTLAEDIGEYLGVGAHLTQLRRTRAGQCGLNAAVSLERLAELTEAGRLDQAVIPMADALAMPGLQVNEEECKRLSHGRSIGHPATQAGAWATGMQAKLSDKKNQLIAIAEFDASKRLWIPIVVLAN